MPNSKTSPTQTPKKRDQLFLLLLLLLSWVESNGNRSSPRIVSGSNDNDLLLLVCYCARAPCFRLFAFWVFIFIRSRVVFSRVFIGVVTFDVNCYTTATLFWLYMPRRSLFFFIGVVVGLLYNIVHTHTSIIEDLSACAFVELGRIVCAVWEMTTKGVVRIPIDICHHIQRSSFLFATSFSISYSFFFLSFLSLDICRRNLGAVDPRINFCLLFPHIVRS
jgi:hypothetical protein